MELPADFRQALNATFDLVMVMTDENHDDTLAHDMIEVHGTGAAAVARQNARTAALSGQATQAKSWIRVLGIIQRGQAGQAMPSGILPTGRPTTRHPEK
jgi:hypothetical protein